MSALTGTWRLARFIVRRDRVRLAIWIVGIAALAYAQGISLHDVYPDQAAVQSYVDLFGDNPALIAFAGPGYGFDDPNLGVVLVNEIQVFGCIATALMSIFLLTRSTRAEEDSERADLVRSTRVGRHAPTAAAVGVVAAANVVTGVLCALAFIAADYPAVGSIALAGSIAAAGLVFTGLTAVAAQAASSGRATIGAASAALAAAFVVRAAGDIGDNGLSWFSPIGWAQAVRAYADERWWTLGLCVAVAAALVIGAFWLATKRDLGSGLRPESGGPPRAAGWITRPLGFAFRLQRGALFGWVIALFITGVVYGSLGEDVDQLFEENPALRDVFAQLGGGDPTDAFMATSMTMLALMAGGFAVSATLHLHGEETAGRVESILSGAVSRERWAISYLAVAVAGTTLAIAAAGAGVGIAYAVVTGQAGAALPLVGAALVTVPGVLVLVGFAMLLVGFAPRASMAAWAGLALMVLIAFLGDILQLPDWVLDLSPLRHLPAVPAESASASPIVAVTLVAGALAAAGLWGLRRRDIQLH